METDIDTARPDAQAERDEVMGWRLQVLGLVLGFVGALLLVIAQGPFEKGAGFERDGRRTAEFVVQKFPRTWRTGLGLLCAGFAAQLLALLMS